ncbi:MAG: hypothetical protein HYV97_15260 [Bdellovibrio sp.]|nr:hypothetical protein [Bdellovibrio sp.]
MKAIEQYHSNYKAFLHDLENAPNEHLPFKVFGPKKKTGDFHSFSCLGQIYKQTENPDQSTNQLYKAPFGEIYKYGCRLAPEVISPIAAAPTGLNQFQGDIFKLVDALDFQVPSNLVLLLSHSCEIDRESIVSVLPVYKESELEADPRKVETIRGSAPKDHKTAIRNWMTNESKLIVGLPPQDVDGGSERLAIVLRDIKTIKKTMMPAVPVMRLSYRGLSYFQIRVAHFFFRDVQDSDESRSL